MFDRKEYIRNYQREWVRQRREVWFKENGPCVKCDSWNHLELDHKDRSTKVAHSIWSWSKTRRDEELAKCQVLCKTCHGEKTREENSSKQPHGTVARYNSGVYKCRCNLCRAAAVGYVRDRRKRLGHR